MTSNGWGEGARVKNGQNLDENGWLKGRGNTKEMGVVGVIGSLGFDVQEWWALARFGPVRPGENKGRVGGGEGVKIRHFSWMS